MTVIPGISWATEDLSKFSETFQHLERCYASNSELGNAAIAEFFAELSQLEQGETLASIRDKARSAVEDLAIPVALLLQTQEQALIIIDNFKKLKARLLASEPKSEYEGLEDIEEAVAVIYKESILIYTLLSKSVDESWNYFPVELHQIFEKLANHLDYRQENDFDIEASILVNLKHLDKESEAAVGNFIYFVRKAVEENTSKPKWQLYKPPGLKFQELDDTMKEEILKGVQQSDQGISDSTIEPEQPQRSLNTAIVVNQEVWKRGERMIALASGGAFLGGLIAQVPGAAVGAVAGAAFGWLERSKETSATENE